MGIFTKLLGGTDDEATLVASQSVMADPKVARIIEEVRVAHAGEQRIPLSAFIDACAAAGIKLNGYMFEGCDLSDTVLTQADVDRLGDQLSLRHGTKLHRSVFDGSLTYMGLMTDASTSMIGAIFQGLDAQTHLVIKAGNISHARFDGAVGAMLEIGAGVVAHNIDMEGAKLAKLIVEPGADLSGANFSHARIVEFKTTVQEAA